MTTEPEPPECDSTLDEGVDVESDVDGQSIDRTDVDGGDSDTQPDRVDGTENRDESTPPDRSEPSGRETRLDPERRAELEQERDFLLGSLTDLEREHRAGDLDDHDYRVLREGYTVRAAAVLREIERGREPVPTRRPFRWKPMVVGLIASIALFGFVWWALAASSAQRLPEQSMTGLDPRSERQQMLSQAYQVQMQRPDEAAAIYRMVLEEYPEDTEALTYGGWTRALAVVRAEVDSETQAAELKAALEMLTTAIQIDPTYPDPNCLRGVLYGRFLDRPDEATRDLDVCLELNPPADMRGLIEGLRAELAAPPLDDQ